MLLALIINTGCSDRTVTMTRAETRLADSLFLIQRNEMKAQIEDSCATMRNELLANFIDSIKATRLAEINLLLNENVNDQ